MEIIMRGPLGALRQRLSAVRSMGILVLGGIALAVNPGLANAQAPAASSTDTAMYFHSNVQDADVCAMVVASDGAIRFDDAVNSPAATCPDAFAWKTFVDTVKSEFWRNWANDETVWATTPKGLCTSASQKDCCFVTPGATPQVGYRDAKGATAKPSDIGGPAANCPYIPGDWGGAGKTTFTGGKPITSHNTTFLRQLDPAKIAREREVEVVYRNNSFVRYTAAQELYSKAGLAKVFTNISGQAANSAPYRPMGQGVSYPPDAVMFKVDWIPESTMVALKYVTDHDNDPKTPPNNKQHPFITMKIKASAGGTTQPKERTYYLAAVTGASKALPNWHWFAFEHVLNLGRCDYIGCNDSYGYKTTLTVNAPVQASGATTSKTITIQSNFIAPKVQSDQLQDGVDIFVPAKRYKSGTITKGLAAVYKASKVGDGSATVDPNMPKVSDPGWRNYRLKGTQTTFFSDDGYPTIMGASITEGGFVNSSSCMSCHVQAAVDGTGSVATGFGQTGRLSVQGIGTVVRGAPYIGDYYLRGTTNQRAVQIDYVWGILFAN